MFLDDKKSFADLLPDSGTLIGHLRYMKLMIKKLHENGSAVTRETFENFGKNIELYPGVENWFDLINKLGRENDVTVLHYLNSSGLKGMVEDTSIAKKFKKIYTCSFMYVKTGSPYGPP